MNDLDTILVVCGVTALGAELVVIDFLDYHKSVHEGRLSDYRRQEEGVPRRNYKLEKPTWMNTFKDVFPGYISYYKGIIKHPFKNPCLPDVDKRLRETTSK